MKCLCIISQGYSIKKSVINGFLTHNWEIKVVDFKSFFKHPINTFITKFEAAPNKIKRHWKNPYINKINKVFLEIFEKEKPDLIFIYNNQNLLPDTVEKFSKKSKIAFMLGDNPLYTHTNIYNLQILNHADYIICPDTFWLQQLKLLGINNLHFDCFSFDPEIYHPLDLSEEQKNKFSSDLAYIGLAHKSSWGYKRFLFLNQFANFNLKAYISGDGYEKIWAESFPDLEKRIIKHNIIDQNFNNIVYNACKIAPIELVPSLFHGIHIRVFDVLGSRAFPLCEYSKDLDTLFLGLNIPFITNYAEANELARYLLSNDNYRQSLTEQMVERVESIHRPKLVIGRMLKKIFK